MKEKKMERVQRHCLAVAVWFICLVLVGSTLCTVEAASKKKISSYSVQLNGRNAAKQTVTIAAGNTAQLQIFVTPSSARKSVSFGTSNKKVAKVNKNGMITAIKEGTAKISVKIKAKKGKTRKTWVKVRVSKRNVYQKYCLLMEKGTTSAIRPDGFTGNLQVATSDPSVIRVNPNQTLYDSGYGTCQITVTGDGQRADITMTVPQIMENSHTAQVTLPDVNGNWRTFTAFHQSARVYGAYNDYLENHGCASCTLTSALRAYAPGYGQADPVSVIEGIERRVAGEEAWQQNHWQLSMAQQMPVSMYGISRILQAAGVSNTYVRSFNKSMKAKSNGNATKDITDHLKKGKAVIFEARAYNRYTGQWTDRWTAGYHTMALLGYYVDGRVLILDSANRSWYTGGAQRIKTAQLGDIMSTMFSCEQKPKTIYYGGKKKAGGYIKINN